MKQLTVFLFLLFNANGFSQPDTTIYVQRCFSYTMPSGLEALAPGQFTDVIPSANGGDSLIVVVIDLLYPFGNQLEFEDGNLTSTNAYLVRWLNCETMEVVQNVEGNEFTPTENGTYAALLYEHLLMPACTTDCFVLENLNVEEPAPFRVNLYPNPTKDIFTMQFSDNTSKKIVVYNALNEIILEKKVNQQELIVNLENQSSGVYLVKTTNDTGEFTTIKLVKQD